MGWASCPHGVGAGARIVAAPPQRMAFRGSSPLPAPSAYDRRSPRTGSHSGRATGTASHLGAARMPTRRSLLAAAPAGAAAVAVAESADPAAAYAPRRGSQVRLLGGRDRHLVRRFSYGLTPALARDVRRAGGALEWFEQQLRPDAVPDRDAAAVRAWWPSLDR